ncbi:MAG: leucine-rich repeat domain-containing protein, partial [Clostridia bacterium]|nr:leucine-rich repeat domain-containing protein [Clostridia bacterium]
MYYKVCDQCYEAVFVAGNANSHSFATEYSFDKANHWFACSKCSATKEKAAHTTDDSGVCTVCKQQITPSKGVVYEISADGTYASVIDYTASATKVTIAEEYEGVPVTQIADSAFQGKAITSILIPDSVTSIGSSAFSGCSSLTSIVIPDGVTSIGDRAFSGCSSLTSITIPDSVTSIGAFAFNYCRSLTSITIPDSVTRIGVDAFYGCSQLIEKVDGVSYVANVVIDFDNSVTSVEIREGTTIIGDSAFYGCSKLRSITIPDSVTSIGYNAFYNCTSLTSITIPDSVTSIGYSAFSGCTSLTSITIPDSVTSIGSSAFSGCKSLESITLPFVGATKNGATNTHFGYIFGNNGYVPSSLKTVVITGGTSIGGSAFSG